LGKLFNNSSSPKQLETAKKGNETKNLAISPKLPKIPLHFSSWLPPIYTELGEHKIMGIISRAIRNLSRRKVRSLLVIVALAISLSIMISIPAGLMANQEQTNTMANTLGNTISSTSASINSTLSQIDVSMASSFAGFGFRPDSTPSASQQGGGGGFFDGQGGSSSSSNSGGFPSNFGGFGGQSGGQFGGPRGGASTPMNQTLYSDIASITGVAAVEDILTASEGSSNITTSFMGRNFTTLVVDYAIQGVPLTSELINGYGILPTNITSGRALSAGESGVVLLSENNSKFFNAEVGDTITVVNETFTVVGIYFPASNENIQTLYMNLSDAQRITNNTDYITSMRVFTTSSDIVDTVASNISSLHSELTVTTQQELLNQLQQQQSRYEEALTSAQSSLATTQATATQEIIVVVAASSMIVLFVMLYTVRERTKEIGTLKAIGFSNGVVMGQFIVEGLVLSVVAGAIGIAIAAFAAPTLSSVLLPSVSSSIGIGGQFAGAATSTVAVAITPTLMLEALGAAVALGVIGSLYPAWRAAKIRPAEAMRYE
jgi:putative ABC transport system permease protein